jgi:O-antigen/teichoic acid export membrane protein
LKVKNILKNTMIGIIYQFINTLVNFITQKMFIVNIGIEYQGLNALLTNIVSLLSLSELGIGTAIIYSLYKPIYENDTNRINALMSFYQKTYRLISITILIIGATLSFFINVFIKNSSFNNGYLRLVFILFVINSAITYLFSYRSSFFFAKQKNYYTIIINLITLIIASIIKILIIIKTQNYVYVIISIIFFTLLTNYIVYCVSNKVYPFLKDNSFESLNKHEKGLIFSDTKNLAISKIVDISIFQTDNILISKFAGLISLGLYSNYYLVIFGVNKFISSIFNAIQPSLADKLVNGKVEEHKENILNSYTMFVYFLATFCCCSYLVLMEDFINLWLGSDFLINKTTLLILIFSQYLSITNQPVWVMSYASGLFKEIRNIGIISSFTNISMSILFGYYYGISGVIFGTCCCFAISIILQVNLTYQKVIRKNSATKYLIQYLLRMVLAMFILALTYFFSIKIKLESMIISFIIKIIICIFIPNFINFIAFRSNNDIIFLKTKLLNKLKTREGLEHQ